MRVPGGSRRRAWPSVIQTTVALAALAVLLAWPVPVALSRASWPARAPATALLLWQAIALAGGLSMIGSLLIVGLDPFGDNLLDGLGALVPGLGALVAGPSPAIALNLLALAAAAGLGIHFVLVLARTAVLIERQRERHRRLIRLLSSPLPDRPHTRLLDLAAPVAYCLPGGTGSVTVLSAGLIELLDDNELRAVVEHEKAHLSQRHYIVQTAFDAWHRSLPRFPIASRAKREVGMLIEMLADDRARRVVDDRTLASAISLVSNANAGASADTAAGLGSGAGVPMPDLSSPSGEQLRARVTRLIEGSAPLPPAGRATVLLAAVALVAVPTVLLVAPALMSLAS